MILFASPSTFWDSIFQLLLTQIWQVALLALAVGLVIRWLAKDRPHLAHVLWVLVLIKCITPPILASPVSPFTWITASTSQLNSSTEGTFASSLDERSPASKHDSLAELPSWSRNKIEPVVVYVNRRPDDRFDSSRDAATNITTADSDTDSSSTRGITWATWAAWLWLGGVAVSLLVAFIRWICFYIWIQRRRCDVTIERQLEADWLTPIKERVGLTRPVRLMVTESLVGPAVIGLWKPTVLLPRLLIETNAALRDDKNSEVDVDEVNSETLTTLIAHELIHIRRGDLWWALLQTIAGCLFWFHPLVWWACRRVTLESEKSCDEETIASLNCSPVSYAKNLIEVLEWKHRLRAAPVVPGIRPIDITTARLERVMKLGNGCKQRTPWWAWLVLGISCCLVLPGAAMGLRAQEGKATSNASNQSKLDSHGIDHQSDEAETQHRIKQWLPAEPEKKDASAQLVEKPRDDGINGETLPSAYYLSDDIQYFPKGPEFKLVREKDALTSVGIQQEIDRIQLPESEAAQTYQWSIPGVLKKVRQRRFTDNLTPEEAIVKQISNSIQWNSSTQVTLTGDRLRVLTTAKNAKTIEAKLSDWRKHGLDQIIIETRFLTMDHKALQKLKLDWAISDEAFNERQTKHVVPFLANLPYASRIYSNIEVESHRNNGGDELEKDSVTGEQQGQLVEQTPEVQTASYSSNTHFSLHTFLDDKQLRALFRHNVVQAPTVRTNLGKPAQVIDATMRPFITKFQKLDPNQPLSANNFQPIVKTIQEGRTLNQKVTQSPAGDLTLECGITIREITEVDTIEMTLIGKDVFLQQPKVSTREIQSKLTLPADKNTAAFCYFDKDKKGKSQACLVTATVRKVTFESLLSPQPQPNRVPANRFKRPQQFEFFLETERQSDKQKQASASSSESIAEWLRKSGWRTSVTGNAQIEVSEDGTLAVITGRKFKFYSNNRSDLSFQADTGRLEIQRGDHAIDSLEVELSGDGKARYEEMNLSAAKIKFRIAIEEDNELFNVTLDGGATISSPDGGDMFTANKIEYKYAPVEEGGQPTQTVLLYGNAQIQTQLSKDDGLPMSIKGDNLRFQLESQTFEAF